MSPPQDMTPVRGVSGNGTNTTNTSPPTSVQQTTISQCFETFNDRPPTKANRPWGDMHYKEKPPGTSRLVFNNVNGISMKDHMRDATMIGLACQRLQVDFLGLAETNLHWTPSLTAQLDQRFRASWKKTKSVTSSSIHQVTTGHYQPGGTATVVTSPWHRRIQSHRDPSGLGRWTAVSIEGKAERKITIITGYRVCQSSSQESGHLTAFHQQWTLLRMKGHQHPDPRQQFLHDLGTFIKSLQEKRHAIILALDANEPIQTNGQLTAWIRQHKLFDVFQERQDVDSAPATYNRGRHRIDFVFISPELRPYMKTATLCPFGELVNSDHRAILLDVDCQKYLNCYPSHLDSQPRGINGQHPGKIKRYKTRLEKLLDDSDLEATLLDLQERAAKGFHVSTQEIERVDTTLTSWLIRLDAECLKLRDDPWSPQLHQAHQTLEYWRLWRTERNTHTDMSVQRDKLTPPPDCQTSPTLRTIKHKIRQAYRQIRKVRNAAEDIRMEHLKRCADMAVASGNIKHEAAVKRILRTESSRKTFAKLRFLMGKSFHGSLDYLITKPLDEQGNFVKDASGNDVEVLLHDRDDIEDTILQRNQNHFSQAEGTPFAAPTLRNLLGKYGNNEASQRLLDGNLDIADLPITDATKSILKQLRRAAPAKSLSATLTAEDLRAGYKAWRESTTTSPSGRHLGHDKALMQFDDFDTDEDDPKPRLSDRIFRIKAALINLCTYTGHVLERWKTVHTLMLEKIPGWPYIEKLRVIHLLENDFNLMVGILYSRRTMRIAESLQAMGDGNAGSRKDRSAEEVHLLKHTMYGITRLTQTNAMSFDNDAKSCFDRIIPLLVSLICQRYGMDPAACKLLLKTFLHSKYFLKTAHGISARYFGGPTTHGTGQGGKASANFWALICATLEACLPEYSDGFQASDPYHLAMLVVYITAFVDDTTLWNNRFADAIRGQYNLTQMLQDAQRTAQWWEQLLSASGGKLELPKCFYYVIHWEFDSEGVPELTPAHKLLPQIEIQDSQTEATIQITQQDCYTAHRTLGAMEAPAPNYFDEFKRLQTKSNSITRKLATAALNATEAQVLTQSIYLPSIAYTFPTGILFHDDCRRIQSPFLRQCLPQLGFNPNTPKALIHGPVELGGCGVQDLFSLQGSIKCETIIRHLRYNRPLGNALLVYFRWAQKVAGTSTSILQETQPLPHLASEQWLETLREFLHASHLRIHTQPLFPAAPQRQHDTAIMDAALAMNFTKTEILRINRCRMFLQVSTVADLATATGKHLTDDAWQCHRRFPSFSMWPYQPHVGPAHRATWQKFLRQLCIPSQQRRLRRTLGAWYPISHMGRKWPALINKCNSTIYAFSPNDDHWIPYHVTRQLRRTTEASRDYLPPLSFSELLQDSLDDTLVPIDILQLNAENLTAGPCPFSIPPTIPDPLPESALHWSEYCARLPPWERPFFDDIRPCSATSMMDLVDFLHQPEHPLIVVSDGSNPDSATGTYGWVMGTADTIFFRSAGFAVGQPMSSHRAEGYGKLAWILFLKRISDFFNLLDLPCVIYSYLDNRDIQLRTRNDDSRRNTLSATSKANYDLVAEILQQQQTLESRFLYYQQTKHVYGHQDTRNRNDTPLTREAYFNILADEEAGELGRKYLANELSPPPFHPLPACPAYLQTTDDYLCSKEKTTAMWRHNELRYQSYMCQRLNLPLPLLDDINWHNFRLTQRALTPAQQRFLPKFLHDWLPTEHKLSYYTTSTGACPFCKQSQETINHFLVCPDPASPTKNFLEDLSDFLTTIKTAPAIQTQILHALTQQQQELSRPLRPNVFKKTRQFLQQQTLRFRAEDDSDTTAARLATINQDKIGWHLWCRGLHSYQWASLQGRFNETLPPSKYPDLDGSLWNRKLTTWLIQYFHNAWKDRKEKTVSIDATKENKECDQQIQNLFNMAPDLAAHDRKVFKTPIQRLLRSSLPQKQQWIKNHHELIHRLRNEQIQRLRNRQPDIRNFFNPFHHPEPAPPDKT